MLVLKSTILEGLPPTPPVPLTPGELTAIRNVVLARIGVNPQNRGLVKVDKSKTKKKKKTKEKKEKSKGSDSSDTSDSGKDKAGGKEKSGSDQAKGGDTGQGGTSGDVVELDVGFMSDFVEGVVPEGSFGGSEDFAGGVDVFDDSGTDSCTQ